MHFCLFGELMLRLSPETFGECLAGNSGRLTATPGGSEANSAVVLTGLGRHKASLLTRLPDSALGDRCRRELRAAGVDLVDPGGPEGRMGLYWVERAVGPRASRVLYDRTGSAFDCFDPERLLPTHLECDWFHTSGITPAISRNTCQTLQRGLELLPSAVPVSLDLNYRSKLWQWTDQSFMCDLYEQLCQRATVVCGNESDFHVCLGIKEEGNTLEERYESIAATVFARFPRVQYMAVSLRGSISATRNSWSGLLFNRTTSGLERHVGPRFELDSIVDRLGAGDAFTAGILDGLASGDEPDMVLGVAVTISALKHTVYGDFAQFKRQDVLDVLKTAGCGAIRR